MQVVRHGVAHMARAGAEVGCPMSRQLELEVVYLVQRGGPQGPVKIGVTTDVKGRMEQLYHALNEAGVADFVWGGG